MSETAEERQAINIANKVREVSHRDMELDEDQERILKDKLHLLERERTIDKHVQSKAHDIINWERDLIEDPAPKYDAHRRENISKAIAEIEKLLKEKQEIEAQLTEDEKKARTAFVTEAGDVGWLLSTMKDLRRTHPERFNDRWRKAA